MAKKKPNAVNPDDERSAHIVGASLSSKSSIRWCAANGVPIELLHELAGGVIADMLQRIAALENAEPQD